MATHYVARELCALHRPDRCQRHGRGDRQWCCLVPICSGRSPFGIGQLPNAAVSANCRELVRLANKGEDVT